MRKSNTIRHAILLFTLTGVASSVLAHATPAKPAVPAKKVVKPSHRPVYQAPRHRSYHHQHLPASASLVVIAGIGYAIVDNAYYKRNGDQYIYIEQAPVAHHTDDGPKSGTLAGTIVDGLPVNTTTVTVNGVTFYVDGNDWYAPIAGTPRFVVVEPQL